MHVGTLIPHFKKGDFDKLLLPIQSKEAKSSLETPISNFQRKLKVEPADERDAGK